ncbi:DNA glycosylase AlkZ-like family protein [uncultured Dysosmobacter sp.]|uniref:DNA glycosylase AlkZ-like family protein n=1 Tax=uncultured Dysosmobacter sp. TaxID=2591384 RepID=UPI0026073C24|nr:crosslink repair DNA glycosylase YcaQ family protein [uncultured Dysosmobacter sp.]
MEAYTVHRPEEAAVRRLLEKHPWDAVGAAVRLAWLAGLMRGEIVSLRWSAVNFLNQAIDLPDRSVPLCPELEEYLLRMSERLDWGDDHVLLSDRLHKPMQPQPISRIVRKALDEEGQTEVRLIDLRHDFVIRQLLEHDWQYVSRIAGIEAVALNQHFSAYLPQGRVSTKIQAERTPDVDEIRLWRLLQLEGTSAAGITLQLTWQAGLTLEEIAALTWEQVDRQRCVLLPGPGKEVPISDALLQFLELVRAERGGAVDPAETVIRAPRSGMPMRPDRLSRVVRAALIKAGIDDITLRDLRQDYALRAGGETRILQYAHQHGYITRNDLMELLQVSKTTAYHRLAALIERGRLVRVGTRYYLPAAVVPPERQFEVIRDYLQAEGPAYRQDIAKVLRIAPKQCTVILKHLVEAGKLKRDKYRYMLRDA